MKHDKSILFDRPDYLVCLCLGVLYSDIIDAIQQGNKTFESLQEQFFVGTGCTSCIAEIKEILEKEKKIG